MFIQKYGLFILLTEIYASTTIALTGQLSAVSWQLHSPHSWEITCDFPSASILKTLGHKDSQVPHPIHKSSLTVTFDIF